MTQTISHSSLEDLVPVDGPNRLAWASDIWKNRNKIVLLEGGVWLLREAATALDPPQEEIDELLKPTLV